MNTKTLFHDKRLQPIRDVALFGILIVSFHFLFRFWANQLHYWPIHDFINVVYEPLTQLLYDNSVWALKHLTTYDFTYLPDKRELWDTSSHGYVAVHYSCSGLKQFLQWIVLMVFFPGPWKHKLWFIPFGLVIIHLVNIFRITGLTILLKYYPEHWQFTHDYLYRPFFYVVMFLLWVWWVEKFRGGESISTTKKKK